MDDDRQAFEKRLRSSSVAVVTHTFATGQAQEFFAYLQDRVKAAAFVGHPLRPHSQGWRSEAELFVGGRKTSSFKSLPMAGPLPLLLTRDLVFTLYAFLRFHRRFDLYYGANNFNAILGIVLRKLGLVRKVIFNTVDYAPYRFKTAILNRLYHWADRFACYHSDYIWNLSPAMEEGRLRMGLVKEKSAPQMVVPIGGRFKEIERPHLDKIKRRTVVFMGHLVQEQGVEMLIDAWPRVVSLVPDARLEVVGTGPLLPSLKGKVSQHGVDPTVEFHGFVPDHRDLEKILSHCAIGVAPYVPDPKSFKWYADPGKPKQYMACGLPVITTNVTPISKDIRMRKAGIVIEYDPEALVNALVKLLTDDATHAEARNNAILLASEFDWEAIFDRALGQVL